MRLSQLVDALAGDGGDPVAAGPSGTVASALVGQTGVDPEVTSVDYDSRAVQPGSLFCCIPGATADGHDFAADAVAAGAVALLVERELDLAVPQVRVDDARVAMGLCAAAHRGWPSRQQTIVGVTGTNGKTTVVQLLRSVFEEDGRDVEVIGTLTGVRTTPESPDLQRQLAEALARGVRTVAMEVSSHAVALRRIAGTRFAMAVFTNLSRDHLDFHDSMEDYFRAKAALFEPWYADAAVVNLDSPQGRMLRDAATVPTTGFSLDDVDDLDVGPSGSSFRWRDQVVHLPLGGRFNVANALAAAEAARGCGVDDITIARGLSRPVPVPGRFEIIDAGQPFTVVVDYAHTPDGLENLLLAANELAGDGRVAVLFGCGGDRDPTKRAPMGEVAARLADRVVLTADNSRGEDTGEIIAAVEQGVTSVPDRRAELIVEPDRRRAIERSLRAAQAGDIVLLAGKGHESTQTLGSEVLPFDDRAVAREVLDALSGGTAGTDP